MFNKNTNTNLVALDSEIARVQEYLTNQNPITKEYALASEQLMHLYKIRSESETSHDRISRDAILSVAGSLAGIAMIVEYERAHVIASKAIGFVSKLR